MKAITLWQPWATLIALGLKRVETREWGTSHRGPIAIHAAKRRPKPAELRDLAADLAELRVAMSADPADYPLGVIVATAYLARCERMTSAVIASVDPVERACGFWLPGRWAWSLEDVQPLDEPVAARGRQQLWAWQPESDAPLPLFDGVAS